MDVHPIRIDNNVLTHPHIYNSFFFFKLYGNHHGFPLFSTPTVDSHGSAWLVIGHQALRSVAALPQDADRGAGAGRAAGRLKRGFKSRYTLYIAYDIHYIL